MTIIFEQDYHFTKIN